MRKYNPKNCHNKLRSKTFTNKYGDKLTLIGKHANEWSVMFTPVGGITRCMIFRSGRNAAKKQFNLMKNAYGCS